MTDWSYLEGGNSKKKHSFTGDNPNTADCGRRLTWFGDKWHNDPEELKKRESCIACTAALLRKSQSSINTATPPNPGP